MPWLWLPSCLGKNPFCPILFIFTVLSLYECVLLRFCFGSVITSAWFSHEWNKICNRFSCFIPIWELWFCLLLKTIFYCFFYYGKSHIIWASLIAQSVKNPPAVQETSVQFLGQEDPLEKGRATHSSILAWRIPWTIQPMWSQTVGYDWATFTFTKYKEYYFQHI